MNLDAPFIRLVLLAIVILCCSPTKASVEPMPGMNNGVWQDSVPLELPDGPGGANPRLSIDHDHNHDNGIIGANYRLNGLSVITRRSGTGGVPIYNADDESSQFLLDGTPLIKITQSLPQLSVKHVSMKQAAIPGAVVPLKPSSHFEPETFTGARLYYDEADNIWVMKHNGWVWEYGEQDSSGANATVQKVLTLTTQSTGSSGISATGTATIICQDTHQLCNTSAWYLSRTLDPFGNEVSYDYTINTLANVAGSNLADQFGTVSSNWPRPDKITYADGQNTVEFDYVTRPDPSIDLSQGVPYFMTKRLTAMRSFVNGKAFSHYKFEYQDQEAPEDFTHSILKRVNRKDTQSIVERNLREIEVANPTPTWGELNTTDSIPAGISYHGDTNANREHIVHMQSANLNGDGVADLLIFAWNCSGLSCVASHQAYIATPGKAQPFIGQETAFKQDLQIIEAWEEMLNENLPGSFLTSSRGYLLADLNNDSWMDLLVEDDASISSLGDVRLIRHRGNDRFDTLDVDELDACKLRFGRIGDVNGDGYQDLIRVTHEETDLCPKASKVKWTANEKFAPHFDWSNSLDVYMPLDQTIKPRQWSRLADEQIFSIDRPVATDVIVSATRLGVCSNKRMTPPKDYTDFDTEDGNSSDYARFGDFNADGVLDVAYSMYGCYDWVGDDNSTSTSISSCGYWRGVEASLYSEIHYGTGDGRFLASGVHVGKPVFEYSEGWAIPQGDGGGPGVDIDPGIIDPGGRVPGEIDGGTLRPLEGGSMRPLRRGSRSAPQARTVSARSSAGWCVPFSDQNEFSPLNLDRGHVAGLLRQDESGVLGESGLPFRFNRFRGLTQGYGLSNDSQVPSDIVLTPTESFGDHHTMGDFDGDGFLDILTIKVISTQSDPGTTGWSSWLTPSDQQVSQGRTVKSRGSFGGETTLQWGFSAEAEHDNPELAINLEVLNEAEGKSGLRIYRYSNGFMSYGDFRGFAEVEVANARGGRSLHGFYTEPARIGLQKYGARLRADDSLAHLSVSLSGARNDNGTYYYNLFPPYYSPLIRQCEYQIGYPNGNGNQTTDIDSLVAQCHDFGAQSLLPGTTLEFDPQIPFELLTNGNRFKAKRDFKMVRSGKIGRAKRAKPSRHKVAPVNRKVSLQALEKATVQPITKRKLSDVFATQPLDKLKLNSSVLPKLLLGKNRKVPAALRWKLPETYPLPMAPRQNDLSKNGTTKVVEYITDYLYNHQARRLESEYLHQDTSTTQDDSEAVYSWLKNGSGAWYQLSEVLLKDRNGNRYAKLYRDDFDSRGFDNAQTLKRCGKTDFACVTESYTWDAHGRPTSATAADDGVTQWNYDSLCGPAEIIDPAGRVKTYRYDNLCLKDTEEWLTSQSSFDYDGFNRLALTTFDAGASTPQSKIWTLQDDELKFVTDTEFTEPRLARLRNDGQLQLTYLDDFGRPTMKVLCANDGSSNPKVIEDVACASGSELVLEFKAYTNDGQEKISVKPHFADEVPRLAATYRDENLKVYAIATPAHTTLENGAAPEWITSLIDRGPQWERTTGPLGRKRYTETTTLARTTKLNGKIQSRESIDEFGAIKSRRGVDGVVEEFEYDSHNRLAARSYQASHSCWDTSLARPVVKADCKGRMEYMYDTGERMTKLVFADGTVEATEYDQLGRATTWNITDGANTKRVQAWQYSVNNNVPLIEITDESGNVTNQESDTLGRITRAETSGEVISREYDINGKIAQLVDINGMETEYQYDIYDRLSRLITGSNDVTEYEYNGLGQVTKTTDADDVETMHQYTYSGKKEKTFEGDWLVGEYEYDDGGRTTYVYTGGVASIFAYNDLDQIVNMQRGVDETRANPVSTQDFFYDNNNRLESEYVYPVEGQKAQTTYRYNSVGMLIETEDTLGNINSFEYDLNGRVRFETDAEKYRTRTRYDGRNRIIQLSLPSSGSIKYSYESGIPLNGFDDLMNRISVTDGEGFTSRAYYDARDRHVYTEFPDGSANRNIYSGSNLSAAEVLDDSGQVINRTEYTYDSDEYHLQQIAGPATPAEFASNNVYLIDYDRSPAGRLQSLSSPVEEITYEYDANGYLERENHLDYALQITRADSYPFVAQIQHEGLNSNKLTVYKRNSAGTITEVLIDDGKQRELRKYQNFNAYGQAATSISLLNDVEQIRHDWTYTPSGMMATRVTSVRGLNLGSVHWDYYQNDVLKSETDPFGNQVVYDYGPQFDYLLDSVNDGNGYLYAKVTGHNRRGQITNIKLSNNERVNFSYNALGQEQSRSYSDGNDEYSISNVFDASGRKLGEKVDVNGEQSDSTYTYDGFGRLLQETKSNPELTIDYGWDEAGNLLNKTIEVDGADTVTYTASVDGLKLDRINGNQIAYDSWGDVITDQQGRSYKRLPSGQLQSVTGDEDGLEFVRDAEGIPWATRNADSDEFIYDLWRQDRIGMPLVTIGSDEARHNYVSDGGFVYEVVKTASNGNTVQHLNPVYDAQNTQRRKPNRSIPVFTAFGEILSGDWPDDAQKSHFLFHGLSAFSGMQGIHFSRYRAYDPQSARFLGRDPSGLRGGFNPYAYANNDPVNYTDALGLFSIASTETSGYGLGGADVSFIPPNSGPGQGDSGFPPWKQDGPFGPMTDSDGCPINASCAADTSGQQETESGGDTVDASSTDASGTVADATNADDPTAGVDEAIPDESSTWVENIQIDRVNAVAYWELDGKSYSADILDFNEMDEGIMWQLGENELGESNLFELNEVVKVEPNEELKDVNTTMTGDPSGVNIDDGIDSQLESNGLDGSGIDGEFGFNDRMDVLGEIANERFNNAMNGVGSSLNSMHNMATDPVGTFMNQTPAGMMMQGDFQGAGWAILNINTMPLQIAGDVAYTGGRAVVGTFTSPYYAYQFTHGTDRATVKNAANQFVDNQMATIETATLITPAGAGRKVLTKGVMKAIPKRPGRLRKIPCTKSFAADTLVLTETGWTAIAEIEVGQFVAADLDYSDAELAQDFDTGFLKRGDDGQLFARVKAAHSSLHEGDIVELLATDTETGEQSRFVGSSNHPFYETQSNSFIEMGELTNSMVLQTDSGAEVFVESMRPISGEYELYNLTVDETANYYIYDETKSSGLLVHNCPETTRKSGVPDSTFQPNPDVTERYDRPRRAGQTTAQKRSVQGKPCVDCGKITDKQVADHKDPLVVQHYRDGKVDVEAQRKVEAVQPHCPACSASQGGQLSHFARRMKKFFGFD